ncbi:MAG: GNAT family N-acetyltransferase [Roseiarcus sp.]
MSAVALSIRPIEVGEVGEVGACFALMRQLRPRLASVDDLEARWRRQAKGGYRAIAAGGEARPLALAGFRVLENFVHGRYLYVDDLVVDEAERGRGLGAALIDWLKAEGKALGCDNLVLDTALANTAAQRFYRRQGLSDRALRFSLALA